MAQGSTQQADGAGSPRRYHPTDLGNADRLVDRCGANFHYVPVRNKFLTWDEQRWKEDTTARLRDMAVHVVRKMWDEVPPPPSPQPEGATEAQKREHRALQKAHDEAAGWCLKSEFVARINAMVDLAGTRNAISPDELDRDPWLLNVRNGTVDLRTGRLKRHDRDDLITKLAPTFYNPKAKAPGWHKFLEEVLPDPEVRAFVQRAAGYSLVGAVYEHVLLLLLGNGLNGKGVFSETCRTVLGDYAQQAPVDLLLDRGRSRSGPSPEIARLRGSRFVTASETDEGRRFDEAFVKTVTGGDRMAGRSPYAVDFEEFDPTHQVWLATNHPPEIRGMDKGIWRRLLSIRWDVEVAKENTRLKEELRKEAPGILAWMVAGCLTWQQTGLAPPEAVRSATQEYRREQDAFGRYLEEANISNSLDDWTPSSDLREHYVAWCEKHGESPLSWQSMAVRLQAGGCRKETHSGGKRGWAGIKLPERSAWRY